MKGKPRPVPRVSQHMAHSCRIIDSCVFYAGFMGRLGAGLEQDWIGPRGHLRQWRVLLAVLRTVV